MLRVLEVNTNQHLLIRPARPVCRRFERSYHADVLRAVQTDFLLNQRGRYAVQCMGEFFTFLPIMVARTHRSKQLSFTARRYAERGIRYANSVRLYVCHTRDLYQNG